MCECGCSLGGPSYRFAGPDKRTWYGVRIYGGCGDCDAPAGVDIFLIGPADYDLMGTRNIPILVFHAGMSSLPVLHPTQLLAAFDAEGMELNDGELSVANVIRTAVGETVREFEAEKKKYAKRKKAKT